jgi:hypothetical protein
MFRAVALLLIALPAAAATLAGRIVDSKTREPIAKVAVIARRTGQRALTDQNGSFTLTLPPGEIELYITTIGYGLVKTTIHINDEPSPPIEIALQQDTSVRKDSVTVSAGPFDTIDANPPVEKTLSKAEIQALSMVLVGDPLRAAQALPGVISDNDFRAEFAVRGASYEHVGIYVDGVLTDGFVHAANLASGGLTSSEKLSLSIINSDNVSEMSLLPGAFPSPYGDSSAAVLNLETRDGNFVKPTFRFSTGLLSTSAVADGPFATHKGSWLLSARSSYADYLQRFIEHITGTGNSSSDHSKSSLDFSDAQVKGTYNFSPQQQAGVSATYGIFTASQRLTPGATDAEQLQSLDSHNLLANAFWRYTPGPHFYLQARGFAIQDQSNDKNRNDATLDDSRRDQDGFRVDIGAVAGSQNLEAGSYVRFEHDRRITNGFPAAHPFLPTPLENYDQRAAEDSYYLQDTWRTPHTALTFGGRVAHSGLTGQAIASPRTGFTWGMGENWTLRAGAGSYAQFPDFEQVYGFFGNRGLQAERATHFNLSLERRLGTRTRILTEVFDREDRNQPFGFFEPLLVNGRTTTLGLPYRNVLRGRARGTEVTVQRRSANGLTGWVSYSYLSTLYTDNLDQLRFVSDFDQRHTVTAFGSYRFRPTLDLSSQWRYGSGVPVPGFYQQPHNAPLSLGPERNTVRLPYYGRLDIRANKAFLFAKWKLTLSAEVLNLLNRTNLIVVSTDPVRIYSTGRGAVSLDRSFGVLPSLAIAVSF